MNGALNQWEELRKGPIAILGAGKTGKGASALLTKFGWEHEIYDEQGRAFTLKEARACSFVITSPGFKADHLWRKMAITSGKEVIAESDFASTFTNSKIIAITGTNGKTTLTSFLCHLWKSIRKPSVVAGNIGIPLSQVLADGLDSETTVFLETSSFQSEDLKFLRPASVIWSNFDGDHLDYHLSKKAYFYAKSKLFNLVKDGEIIIGNSVQDYANSINYELPIQSQVVSRLSNDHFIKDKDHFLQSYPQTENMAIAYAFAKANGIKKKCFKEAMLTYKPEPHRLQKLDTIGNAVFWNDSKSTNFASSLSACKNFNEGLFWIGGGRKKGGMVEEFAHKIKPLIKKAFLIGETGYILSREFSELGLPNLICESLDQAVQKAFYEVKDKTHILFSPGFASFDSFKDYIDRGNSFINLVLDLKKVRTMTTHYT